MAAPPTFSDLGKSAKDLFSKGYAHGLLKLDVTTKSGPTVEFKTQAEHNMASEKMKGNLEVKYKIPEHGATITEKWNTDNQLISIVEVNNRIAKGLKVTLDASYTPHNAKRGALFKTDYSGEMFRLNSNMTLFGGPIIDVSGVTKLYSDWLVGGLAKYDMQNNELKSTFVAIARQTPEYTVHTFTDGREFGASLYHKTHKNFEYGVQLGWKMGDQGTQWGFATKYQANPDLCLRAKIDHKSQISFAATHNLSEASKLTISTHLGLAGFPETPSKFGLGLEYAP